MDLADFPFQEILDLRPHTSQRDVAALVQDAAMLLLTASTRGTRYRPGRLYDDLASSAPVLVHGVDGEVGAVIRALNAGEVIAADDDATLERVIERLVAWDGVHASNPARRAWIERHNRRTIAVELFRHLDALIGIPRAGAIREPPLM